MLRSLVGSEMCIIFFFQAEDGIRGAQESRGLGTLDTQLMYSDAVSFDGMPENSLDVDVWFYVENYDAADPLVVIPMG